MKMKAAVAIQWLNYAAFTYAASDAARPRGVSPKYAKFFNETPDSTFACIHDPSIKIPYSRINDDYCDCPDGSDEPGTSACSHLSPLSPATPADAVTGAANALLAFPGFWCANKGHIPAYVPFMSVNDGICDYELCCDGSEEWQGIGGVKCEDRCKEIGKVWRKADEARQRSLGNAARKRAELVREAEKMRKEVQDRIGDLGIEIQGAELRLKQAEGELVEVEKREKGRVVRSEGVKGGKLGVLVSLAKSRTGELRESLERVRRERDDYYSRLGQLEELLAKFKEDYNPNFNDEGVKRAVRAWEDYAANGKAQAPNEAENKDLDEITKADEENGIDWAEYENAEESDTDVLYAFENYLPPSLRSWLDQKLRDLRVSLIDAGILADNSKSSGESKAVTDARKRVEDAQRDLENNRNDLKSREEELTKDFGPDDVFRALKGTCVSTDTGEYTYELCFLDRTVQKSKKGGGHTNMGNFEGFDKITVDEEVPANGKGLGTGERIVMKHENGQHCWNGPNRSTTVILACAEENEIWKVMEEAKCVYRMEVGTPAVCEKKEGKAKQDEGKDEL